MALIVADRVQELTTTSGTGTLTLNGAVSGFQTFSNGIGNTNTTYYTIYDPTAYVWEVGIGTVGAGTLSRDTVLANSLGTTAKINLAGNQASVFCTYPADKSVNLDASGNVTPLGTISSGTWQGTTVGVAYGGTGVTSSSGANSVVIRDSNQNITANRINQSNTNTTAAGGTTALTSASSYSQTLVGTGNQTYTMPDATTLTTGVDFVFNNNATGTLTIRDAASGLLGTVSAGGACAIMLLDNGTVAGTWNLHGFLPENVTWGTNALDLGTTIVSNGTWQGGTIQSGYGGTGLTTFVAANNALYSTSASALTAGTLPILAGGTGATTAPNARTNLGATTVGGNLFTLTNPSAITFPRFNADNTVSALNAADFRTAIGAGTGSGDVVGPASATDNAIARFDGTTGKLIQNSAVTIADDGSTVISVNTTADALRITQTGSGNALVVEDSANPDATPFVINNAGSVFSGSTSSAGSSATGVLPRIQFVGTGASGSDANNASAIGVYRFFNDTAGGQFTFFKSRSGSPGSFVISNDGDLLGNIFWQGDDGTGFPRAASIQAFVDGTPGTNSMPGRLVFSTSDTATSNNPKERMRIDSAGQVGIGTTSLTGYGLRVGKNITGATSAFGVQSNGAIQSDVTTGAFMFRTAPTTQNATFTLPTLAHYDAAQGAFGASSTVTNQYGFVANSSLTGATNNYGFFSNIASGANRWNFYANGTADNYFGGDVIINVNTTDPALRITQIGTGNALVVEDSANPDATPTVIDQNGRVIVGGATPYNADTVTPKIQVVTNSVFDGGFGGSSWSSDANGQITWFAKSKSGTIGTHSAVASGDALMDIRAFGSDGTAFAQASRIMTVVDGAVASNSVPSRISFQTTTVGQTSATEKMRIDNAGRVGINTTAGTDTQFQIAGTYVSSGTNTFVVQLSGTAPSTSTNRFTGYRTTLATQATSFTLADLRHYEAAQGTFGAGSTVTNQYGFLANSSLTGATNNFGFYSDIPSGTGRWNFYANGTANNAFAGNTSFGTTAAPTVAVDVVGTVQARPAATQDAVAIAGRAGGTSSFVATITPTTLTASRTFTLPDATTTIVGTDTTQTLTNKTLTSPRVGTAVLDTNGNEVFAITATASAVNEFTLVNAATGNSPQIQATGGDTNISLNLVPKGTGTVQAGGVPVVTTTGTQTLTNKTLTEPTITGTIIEDVFPLSDAGTINVDPANGSIQYVTLGGTARILTFTSMVDGEAITLMINDGTSGSITTWNLTFVNNGGAAPTLSTSGFTVISVWKVNGTVYAAVVGNA